MWNGEPENWIKIAAADPQNIAASGSELYADFGSSGIWKWNGTLENWTRVSRSDPRNLVASGSELYGDFGSSGIWRWNGIP
jgi:hypothetical protein